VVPTRTERLGNGMMLVVRPLHFAPVAAVQVWLDVGAADDPEDLPGMAHLFEHLLFKHNPSRRFRDLVGTIESVGGAFDAWTSHDHTVYEVLVPSRQTSLGLEILADALSPPAVDEEVLRREGAIIVQEERQRADDPWTDTADVLVALAFQGHRYARSVTGDPRRLRRATAEDVLAFHDRNYRAERMLVVVAGDVDPAEVRAAAEASLGRLPGGGGEIDRPASTFDPQARVRTSVEVRAGGLGYVGLGFRLPGAAGPSAAEAALIETLLGDGPSSLVTAELVRRRELAVHAEVSRYPERDASVLAIVLSVEPSRWYRVLGALLGILSDLRERPVPLAELERARRLIAARALYGGEAVEDIAERTGFDTLVTGDPEWERSFMAAVAAATPEDLLRAAGEWFRPDRAAVAVMLPEQGAPRGDEDADRIRERIRTAVAGTLGIASRPAGPPAPLDVRLTSGARLVVRPEPGAPLVAVDAFLPGGRRLDAERTAGLQTLMARLLLRGTGVLSAGEIDRAIDEMAATVEAYAAADSLGISAQFPAGDALRGLALLADCLRSPAFPEAEFERERRRMIADVRDDAADPYAAGLRELYLRLLPGHPYRLDPLGTEESLARLTHRGLLEAWRTAYPVSRLTWVVSGDIAPDAILRTLEDRLAADEAGGEPIPALPEPMAGELPEGRRRFVLRGDFAQAYVLFGFPAPGSDSPRRHAVSLLVEALTEDSGLLMEEIREARGLAYDVGAEARLSLGQGVVLVSVACDPRNVDAVVAAVNQLLEGLADPGLGEERLAHAQNLLIGSYALDLQRVADRNRLAAYGLLAHDRLPSPEAYEAAIREVTPDRIREEAAQLFDVRRGVTVVVLPNER
jgi:zinc protease